MYLTEFINYYTDGQNHYTGKDLSQRLSNGNFIHDSQMYAAMCEFIELTDAQRKAEEK